MQMERNRKLLSYILCIVLIVAMALFANGCNGGTGKTTSSVTETEVNTGNAQADTEADSNADEGADAQTGENILGEGNTEFTFIVSDQDGNETSYEIHTDKETVGEALLELGLIDGEESEYGLYVKTVNGITADYDADGVYWAFYVNGEYAQSGVDSTTVIEGDTYSFRVE